MSKHTPGPWVMYSDAGISTECGALNADGGRAIDGDAWVIAEVSKEYTNTHQGDVLLAFRERVANARLIAAAPELLTVVKSVAAICEGIDAPIGNAARAAIAKAEGEA